ncbi:MAG: hypothetical protein ACKOI2_00070 [Actinomycetota bacterium]
MKSSIRLSLALLVSTLVLQVPKPAEATTNVSIGNVTLGTKSGSQLGRDPLTTYPILNYCVTFKTDSQAMDYGFEVIDSNGVRPPFGSAFSSLFLFVPDPDWNSGSTLGPRTVCNSTTLENNKSYTIRAWLSSGSYATRGTWALPPSSTPTSASYVYTPTNLTPTTIPTTSPTNSSSDPNELTKECPPAFPISIESNGQVRCLTKDQYCTSDQNGLDAQPNIQCDEASVATSPSIASLLRPKCTATLISRQGGRASIQLSSNELKNTKNRFDVQRIGTWFIMGSTTFTPRGIAVLSTRSSVINTPGSYTIRAVSKGKTTCEGVLILRKKLALRGPALPAKP